MLDASGLASLAEIIADEGDFQQNLKKLLEQALALTHSRNALIGRMNDDLGVLELSVGVGPDWVENDAPETLQLGTDEGLGIVAWVAKEGESFVTGNVHEEPLYRDLFTTSKSEIAIPVIDRYGRTRGVLNLESDQEDHYTSERIAFAESLVQFIAVLFAREEMQRREEAYELIGSALDRATTQEDLIANILSVAGDVLRFQSCSIFLHDPTIDKYVLRGTNGPIREKVGVVGYGANEGFTGWVSANGTPIRIDHPQNDPRWQGRWLEFPQETVASFLAVPIVYRGRSQGCIRVVRRQGANPYQQQSFTEEDERLLTTIAEQMAVGLENIRQVSKAIQIERMAAWGELSAKSSHMIGNRVFALKGDVNELGYLIEETPTPLEDLRKITTSLRTNVQRVEEILQEFRDFVVATQLTKHPVEFNRLVEGAVHEMLPRRSEVKVLVDYDHSLGDVELDERKVRRALTELVENALSFEASELKVRTFRADPSLKLLARLPKAREFAAVEIVDNGPGVDSERKEQIFQPFYSSRVKGMGLGLSIVKGIVDAHGGAVIETGEEGGGARFVILLPTQNRRESEK